MKSLLKRALPACCVGLAAALLAACGQKGPLYLPQKPAVPATAASTAPTQTAPASPASR